METATAEESPQQGQLPEFDVSFRDPLPPFYFHHIIDPIAATLRVEVLGPNLAYTFRHERAKELRLSVSTISQRLERKTTGFLALQTDKGNKRIVLAWAESGNGAGRAGDLLDSEPSALPNDIWTQRVISTGKILAMRMRRPFDGRLSQVAGRDMSGVFLGGHVEAKLAVHAVFVLLSKFGITQDLDNVSLRHLKMLRQARWDDGSRPAFEIYFSRKNCGFCGKFVKRLQRATGVPLGLIWRDRLVKMVYEKRPLAKMNPANRPQATEAGAADDGESLSTDIMDEVHVIDLIDLSREHGSVVAAAASAAEIINLTGDDDDGGGGGGGGTTGPTRSGCSNLSEHEAQGAAVDAYIDGMAYCVGQIEQCPSGAQTAILELAEKVCQQRSDMARRAALANINKPLPATPQMAPPGWMAAPAGTGATDDAAASADAETALLDPLPTPPSSGGASSNFRPEAPQSAEATRSRPLRSRLALGKERDDARTEAAVSTSGPRAKRASICVELPSRRCSSSPDPF
ncbi:hypothetical protein Trco_008296 [Trichoderma cornu-damae]|uniref:Uncharacterized protein n=1 Tax=Trichoderma cornu-damae TaxID=654480 RepID=A0A9P8QDZ4_9HYPO|nr:hypothetical protein Trco_008296 [Trichoderma cornu-damae]